MTRANWAIIGVVCTLGLGSPAAATETILEGACDGSTATLLSPGRFVVGDDDRNVLLVHSTGASKPAHTVDLTVGLGTKQKNKPDADGNPRFDETDIEASARVGDRIYWTGSFGRDGDGDPDPARERFFATAIGADGGLKLDGTPYRGLRADLLASVKAPFASAYRPDIGKNGPAPESDNGFNIEAMAATPSGSLLIGFRNPRPAGKALLIELTNPAAVVETGAKAVFAGLIELDLGGRGLRALEPVDSGYLLLAGPHGKAPGAPDDFLLYSWTGDAKAVPKPHPGLIPPGFAAEAMVVDGPSLTLLSDEGDTLIDGKRCKDVSRAQMRFRALSVPVPK